MDETESREKKIRSITLWGAICNLILSILKVAAGILGHSQAVLADGVHSFSDLATDAAILVGSRYWSRPADISHPHGHRRIETLVSFGIGAALFTVGIGIGYNAIITLRRGEPVVPGMIALYAALASIVVKEILYRWTVSVATKVKSPAVIANAWHHRSDALSSIPAAAAVAGAAIMPELAFLDPVGGIIVALFIVHAAGRILLPVIRELSESGAPVGIIERIGAITLATDGVRGVHHIRTRYVGSRIAVDLHVTVNDDLTILEAHSIGDDVSRNLREREPEIIDVVAHLEPVSIHDGSEPVAW